MEVKNDVNIKLLLPVLCFIFSLYGIYQYVNNQEENMCVMTYMFEYPEYLVSSYYLKIHWIFVFIECSLTIYNPFLYYFIIVQN